MKRFKIIRKDTNEEIAECTFEAKERSHENPELVAACVVLIETCKNTGEMLSVLLEAIHNPDFKQMAIEDFSHDFRIVEDEIISKISSDEIVTVESLFNAD